MPRPRWTPFLRFEIRQLFRDAQRRRNGTEPTGLDDVPVPLARLAEVVRISETVVKRVGD